MAELAKYALMMYRGVIEQGGTEEEATRIVQAYMSTGLMASPKE